MEAYCQSKVLLRLCVGVCAIEAYEQMAIKRA